MTRRLDQRNRIIRTSEYQRDLRLKQSTAGKTQRKDACLICYTTFPTDHKNVFVFRGPDGTEVRICYYHITDITNQPRTYFPRLPLEQSPIGLDLVEYLNGVRKILGLNDRPSKSLNDFLVPRPTKSGNLLPGKSGRSYFDLVKYLKESKRNLDRSKRKRTPGAGEEMVQTTLAGVVHILDLAKISQYIGSYAEFVKGGLKPLKKLRKAA